MSDDEKTEALQKRVLRQERRIKWRNEQIASLKVQLAQVTHRADHYQARCRELAFERLGINVVRDHLSAALDELHGPLQ
jgi:chromosome segregation ATPase